jgi:hypothetical protein
MNGKVANEQSAEAHLTKLSAKVEPCVKGREALAPRDLAAYLRLINGTDLEEAGELPPHVQAHLDSCSTCQENRNLLERTDPILRGLRKKRVGLIIRVVEAAETAQAEEEKAGTYYGEELAAEKKVLVGKEQEQAIAEVQDAMALANSELVQEAHSVASEIRNVAVAETEGTKTAGAENHTDEDAAKPVLRLGNQEDKGPAAETQSVAGEPLHLDLNDVCKRIGDISVKVGALTDEQERVATTDQVCGVFNDVFMEWLNKEYERGELPFAVLEKLMKSQSQWIDLSKLPVPMEVAIAFFSSFPETISSGRQDLFQDLGDTIRFNWERYQELRKHPGAVTMFGNGD